MQRQARLFRLVRPIPVPVVAEGVEWSDGAVALRWQGRWPSTSTWDTLESLLAVHGTSGHALHWLTEPPPPPPAQPRRDLPPVWLPAPTPDGLCSHCGTPWPCLGCDA
jgi:hypothetical protein